MNERNAVAMFTCSYKSIKLVDILYSSNFNSLLLFTKYY